MNEISSQYITLTQFLKMQGFASTGGQAKFLVKELDISVNGEKEDRRGRKLYPGDVVIVDGRKFVIG
ncbi:MAG: RNA-binding S4 domain-containing protein [Erysipelotrichaceae bacterium]|nr:RNA-binding S4 domain-containing protein [Erysipelotrichaceae bacterium]